ncbi:MAG: alpha/beta hydrolase family protein [Candidatus Dormibacteria bacterium]
MNARRFRAGLLPLVATVLGAAALPAAAAPATQGPCSGDPSQVLATDGVIGLAGLYALPSGPPAGLVVFAHGYRNSSQSWTGHLTDAAGQGYVAVAVDYRGLGPAPDYRGWPARAGAEDLVTAGAYFQQLCGVSSVGLLGVSMGGNMSGLAAAAGATRTSGGPLFNYWVDVEGATNVSETYGEALVVGQAHNYSASAAYADGARADIEAEAGGTPLTATTAYRDITVVDRVQDIAAGGLSGVVIVHGVEDGLVPYDQSRELATGLRALRVPTDVYSVLRRTSDRDPGHDQTTLLSDAGLGDQDPFAGHGWEGSNTHIVIMTGIHQLYSLMQGGAPPSGREFLVDSGLGTVPVN